MGIRYIYLHVDIYVLVCENNCTVNACIYVYVYYIHMCVFSKKIATHSQNTPQAIPLANYERNPFIACW